MVFTLFARKVGVAHALVEITCHSSAETGSGLENLPEEIAEIVNFIACGDCRIHKQFIAQARQVSLSRAFCRNI